MLRSMNLKSLNPHITCVLCGGYLVDATTIIECLHSFCRSCIVRYLDTSVNCPVCDVEIHKTRPLLHIRPDHVLQDIVYKLVPGLCHEEQKLRKEMQEKAKLEKATKEPVGETEQLHEPTYHKDTNEVKSKDYAVDIDDPVCLSLEYYGRKRYLRAAEQIFPTRYLRCSSKVTVGVLKKFLSAKFGIPSTHQPELVRSDEILDNHITMKELSRIYGLYTKSYLDLQYIFLTTKEDDELKSEGAKKIKIDDFHRYMQSVQPQLVKPRRRRRRNKQNSTEQQEELPKKKRRKRRKTVETKSTKSSQIKSSEQLTHKQSQEEKCDLTSRVSYEGSLPGHDRHSPFEIKQNYQMEQEQDLAQPAQQPTEVLPNVIKDESNIQLQGQQFKENERTKPAYVNVIRHQFRPFPSVVKHTEDDDKEPLDLFKVPSLPPLRSSNLDRQTVALGDSFC